MKKSINSYILLGIIYKLSKDIKYCKLKGIPSRIIQTAIIKCRNTALHGKLNSSHHLLQIMKKDGRVSEKTKIKRTKCTKIITNTLAPLFRKFIISDMLVKLCSFFIVESTDISGCRFFGKRVCVCFVTSTHK